ncbi:MAG: hypothetical protein E7551_03465 [Ruminococcaceae bacterium]|nr:hypothetical protein [Oscillospiraceae bacterium]
MFIKKSNACPCAYCKYFELFEYTEGFFTIQKGVCKKHYLIRELGDILCQDFILKSGVYTNKWYPTKNENENT